LYRGCWVKIDSAWNQATHQAVKATSIVAICYGIEIHGFIICATGIFKRVANAIFIVVKTNQASPVAIREQRA
jgi:hypothetical protein